MEKLKKCPFCGGEKIEIGLGGCRHLILCDECGAVVSFIGKEDKEQAVQAWNKREGEQTC